MYIMVIMSANHVPYKIVHSANTTVLQISSLAHMMKTTQLFQTDHIFFKKVQISERRIYPM